MAKKAKGNRVQVILECTEQKASGVPGISRYITTKNKKNPLPIIKKARKRITGHCDEILKGIKKTKA